MIVKIYVLFLIVINESLAIVKGLVLTEWYALYALSRSYKDTRYEIIGLVVWLGVNNR